MSYRRSTQSLAIVMLAFLSSCQEASQPVMGNQTFALSGAEIAALERNANEGDCEAAQKLANYYGFVRSDQDKQIYWLRVGADAGDVTCQTNLAMLLQTKRESAADDDAFQYLKVAADAGGADAQLMLAEAYEEGRGTTPDLSQARIWYERSANQGVYRAMIRSGELALEGVGGPADEVLGVSWLLKARRTLPEGSVLYRELSDAIVNARRGMTDSQFEEAKRAAE